MEEGKSRTAKEPKSDEVKELRNHYFVPIERLQKQSEFVSAFFARKFTAQAHFRNDSVTAFDKFSEALQRVQTASGMLIETVGLPNNDPDFIQETREEVYENFARIKGRKDKVGRLIEDAVAVLEKLSAPVLEWTGGQQGVLRRPS